MYSDACGDMCREPAFEAPPMRWPAGTPGTGVFFPTSSLVAANGCCCDSIGASRASAVSETCTERATTYYRQDSGTSSCSSMGCSSVYSPTAGRQYSPPNNSSLSSRQQHSCQAAAGACLSHHSAVLPTWEAPEELLRVNSRSQAWANMQGSSSAPKPCMRPHSQQSDYEAWLAAAGQLAAVAPAAPAAALHLRRPHSLELPAMEMRQQATTSRVSKRRYSYHQGPSHMPPAGGFNHGRPPAMPYNHTAAAARQYADETAAAAAAATAYGSWSSRQHSGHFSAVLPSVPDVPDCSSSLPADYGSDQFLLDEQVQALLVDVISAVGGELPAPAPAGMTTAELKVQQQRNMMRHAHSMSRQKSADASYGRLPGMPAAAAAPALPGSGDAAADALSALNSYMLRHEQQKQRHQQCISAAAAAAALNASSSGDSSPASYSGMPAGGVSGLAGLAGAAGLSKQAQDKLQELMAAQQMQLEIQMELLQLLSAA